MPSFDNTHPASTVTLSSEQFDKLVELLTPGYEMAKIMLAQMQAQEVSGFSASGGEGTEVSVSSEPTE